MPPVRFLKQPLKNDWASKGNEKGEIVAVSVPKSLRMSESLYGEHHISMSVTICFFAKILVKP